jgi:hypothetical protein
MHRILTDEERDALPASSVIFSSDRTRSDGMRFAYQKWDDGQWYRGRRSAPAGPNALHRAILLFNPNNNMEDQGA